jgi:4-aminobutyrate aminotransferase-like enzyme
MTELAATKLALDPRIQQAKALLLESVKDAQSVLTGVRPPNPRYTSGYEQALSRLQTLRGAKTYFPYLGSGIGNGALVELLDGSVKYDFISGIGVHHFGHSHPEIVAASIEAALADTVMQGHLQQNGDTLELSERLVKLSGMDHCFISSSGAMANENALKLIFQHHQPAYRILAFDHCFMGRTWSLAQITDKAQYRLGLPANVHVDYIPFFDANHPEASTARALEQLRTAIARYPKQHAMMVFELVQGEAGFYPGSHEFFKALMTICKEHSIAIFIDEIQTFGRLPQLFAYQYFGLQEYVDLVTIGKLSQVCATLFSKRYLPQPGLLSQTFTASTAAIQISCLMLDRLASDEFLGKEGKNAKIGAYFSEKLTNLSQKHPSLICGPFGIGAMVAFTPLGGDEAAVNRFVQNLFQAGVISFVAGKSPTRVRFLVPVGAVTYSDIDNVTQIVEQTLVQTSQQLTAAETRT